MKYIISVLLFISFNCNAQEYSEQQMQQKTLEAVAKFYKLDIIGQKVTKEVQEKYLPKSFKPYVPYFMTIVNVVRDQKLIYRREF